MRIQYPRNAQPYLLDLHIYLLKNKPTSSVLTFDSMPLLSWSTTLEAVMTTLGISPGLPVDLPQVGSTAPLCMTFSSWYGAGFNVSDFLTWNLDTSWETMWAGFLPSLCEPYFASVIRMFKVPEVYLLSQLIDGIKPTLYFWPPYFVQLVFSPKLMASF